jgi:hypothetical protein
MTNSVNVGEYGVPFNFLANIDLSGATSLQLLFTRSDSTTFTGTAVIGNVALVTTDAGTFPANQYVKYTFKSGDLTVPGIYSCRLVYMDSAPTRLISYPTTFQVYP